MKRSIFFDKLTFLKNASLKIDDLGNGIQTFLSGIFRDNGRFFNSKKNAFGQTIHVQKELSNLTHLYLEDAVSESNVYTATRDISLMHWAQVSGHYVSRAISSKGIANLLWSASAKNLFGSEVIFRKYAQLKCSENSLVYLLNINEEYLKVSTLNNTQQLPLIEGLVKTQTFYATGIENFTINLDDVGVIEEEHIQVTINGRPFKRVASFFDMQYNEKAFYLRNTINNQIDVCFGNTMKGYTPKDGEEIVIEYLTTSGEFGNILNLSNSTFEFVSGIFNSNGEEIDINDNVLSNAISGFSIGSNGTDRETTRNLIGKSSKSLVLANSDNFEAFLSRLSFLSKVKVHSKLEDKRVKTITVLPNIMEKIRTYADYLSLSLNDFLISQEQKTSIQEYIETSERVFTSTELAWNEPVLKKYAVIIYGYFNRAINDEINVKDTVSKTTIEYFIQNTFAKNVNSDVISTSILSSLLHAEFINSYKWIIHFISEENEEAKINGFYNVVERSYINNIEETKVIRKELAQGENPRLGLTLQGDIPLEYFNNLGIVEDFRIPILQGGFTMQSLNEANQITNTTVENPIMIVINDGISSKTL